MDAKFPFFFFSIVSLVCFDRFRSRIFLTLRENIFLLDREWMSNFHRGYVPLFSTVSLLRRFRSISK